MCGRYEIDVDIEEMNEIISKLSKRYPEESFDTGEIFPTNVVPILLQEEENLEPEIATWGFPHFKGSGVIINARAESVVEKPTFRESFFERRCVIPSTAFFEWTKDEKPKKKYVFNVPEAEMVYMAGLYKEFQGLKKFVILTSAANSSMADVHDRMPVILTKSDLGEWVDSVAGAQKILSTSSPIVTKEEC